MEKLYIQLCHYWIMKRTLLTKREEKVLYGLVKYPEINDSTLSNVLDIKLSTLTSIKRRLSANKFYNTLNVPMLNCLGCELLAIIYMHFNPVIPLETRIQTTKRTIEVFDEIFFSVGEQEKGFSISLSQNYTNIGRINEIRTETFGKLGLLEKEYPQEVVFTFETSHISRFFDYSRLLKKMFSLNENDLETNNGWFDSIKKAEISLKEKKVYTALVEYPNATTQKIGDKVGLSRHTVARMRNSFFKQGLLKQIAIPNLKKLGVEILTFYHIRFNPNKAPKKSDIAYLDSPYTVFLASRKFETVVISAYPTYQDYKEDEMNKIRFLKENNLIAYTPFVGTYMFENMAVIKDFDFAPITKKILASRQNNL
jgi:DNA-binding MarR family transcriptional regulator